MSIHKLKKQCSDVMSRYVRLRDALEYCKVHGIDLRQFTNWLDLPCRCCTCWPRYPGRTFTRTIRQMDAGHYIGRGLGGGSGVYFDERNVNTQCRSCNAWADAHTEYRKFIIEKYGQEALDDLEFRHKNHKYTEREIIGLTLFYKQKFEEMVRELQNGC